jgi:hypothetical protein
MGVVRELLNHAARADIANTGGEIPLYLAVLEGMSRW